MAKDYEDSFRHEALRGGDGPSAVAIFKLMLGTLLIVAGAALGVYLAEAAMRVVFGDEPPPMMQHISELTIEKAKAEVPNPNIQTLRLAPDVMQTIQYGLTFFLLLIPMIIATSLISAGVKLMRGEASEVVAMLAAKLSKRD
ncbi:hypothetical protein [Blastopirellula marina]|uniref:Uncharacterized protein n=1 Tax=Blastopirellula marina TaxID=124 RepID=A0A2S8GPB0_9BACT|nr:hypothetical protein [Blastopirellula marina]PQO46265.1 hypothetical protein C5Y93_09775 [Blastopirellula marina]